jgi:hypothetical protein
VGKDGEDRSGDTRRRTAIADSTSLLDEIWIARFEAEREADSRFERMLFWRAVLIVLAIILVVILASH